MMEASFYDKIMNQQRLEPEFFRVGFYGKKFPFFLRVRLFELFIFWNKSWYLSSFYMAVARDCVFIKKPSDVIPHNDL